MQVFEIGEFEGRPYFTLEYVDGGALTDRLKKGPVTPAESAKIIEDLARTMHLAHLKKVIHRDLKPANILLTQAGAIKITDFGLAKRLDTSDAMTMSGAVMGTPAYMAPEQARGRIREIGAHTDVYSLGAILYELITGLAPFRGTSTIEMLQQVADVAPQRPRTISTRIDSALEAICMKCLEKTPADRYASAELLAADLAAYQRGDKVMAEQHSNLRMLQMFTRDTRHVEVMVRFRKVNMANSALIFIFSILTEVFLTHGMNQPAILGSLWGTGAVSMMLTVWWFRYRDPLPVVLIERQIVMVWGCFVAVAVMSGIVLQHQNIPLISIFPVLFLEASLAVGAMAIIIGGTFYTATVLTAILGLTLGFFPQMGIGIAGALQALIVFLSVLKFNPARAAAMAD